MHESGLIEGIISRAEAAAGGARIVRIVVWIGALAPISSSHLRAHFAAACLGTAAEGAALDVVCSDDPLHPQAQGVLLQSLEVEE